MGIAPGRCGRRDHPIRCELLTGYRRRRFQAEVALKYCSGSARRTETVFGWGRDAVHTGLNELRSGIRCLDAYHLRGRKKTEKLCPAIEEQIRRLVDPHCQADPKFQTALAFTRITAKAVREQLLSCPAVKDSVLPARELSLRSGEVGECDRVVRHLLDPGCEGSDNSNFAAFGDRVVSVEFIRCDGGVKIREMFDAEETCPHQQQRQGWQASSIASPAMSSRAGETPRTIGGWPANAAAQASTP